MKTRFLLLTLLVPLGTAQGVDFCVSNAAELQDALTQSQFNDVDDNVMLTTTSVFVAPATGFTYDADSTPPQALTIEGGYSAFCAGKSNQSKSVVDLSGVTAAAGFGLQASQGTLRIIDIALRFKPHIGNGNGGAVRISGTNAVVAVEGSAFYSNTGNGGSALGIRGHNISALIRDNVFAGNNSKNWTIAVTGALPGQDAAECVFENNTIYANNETQAGDSTGLLISNCLMSVVSNNIVHSNDGTDLQVIVDPVGAEKTLDLHSNDIEDKAISATIVVTESSTLQTPPNLGSDPFKMQPPPGSPLIDAGVQPLLPNEFDFRGKPRKAGAAVDIGAFEVQTQIFADGFEDSL